MANRNRDGGWRLPEVIEVEGRKCIRFEIPDDPHYIAAATGAITRLAQWFNWEKGGLGDRRATEAATFVRGILADTLKVLDDCEDCEEMPQYSIGADGCEIVLYADGQPVSSVDLTDPALSECLPEGPQGPAGPAGPAGPGAEPPVEEGGNDIPAPDLPGGTDSRCGIAETVSAAIRDVYYLPALEEYILQTVDNGMSHLDFMRYVQTQFGFIGWSASYIPAILAWVNALSAGSNTNIYNNTNTSSFLEAIKCELYCALRELNADEITAEVRSLWIEKVWQIDTEDARAVQMFAKYLEAFKLFEMRAEALYATDAAAGACDECECASDLCAGFSTKWDTLPAPYPHWSSPPSYPSGVTNPYGFPLSDRFIDPLYEQMERVSNGDWSAEYSQGTHPFARSVLVKYDLPEPCVIEKAGFKSYTSRNGSKIFAVLVETTTGEIRAVGSEFWPAPTPTIVDFHVVLPEPLEAVAVYFVLNAGNGNVGITVSNWIQRNWINQEPP